MDVRYINWRRDDIWAEKKKKNDEKISAKKAFGSCPGRMYRKQQSTKEALEIVCQRKGKASVTLET